MVQAHGMLTGRRIPDRILVEVAFSGGQPLLTRVDAGGRVQGAGERLEDGFGNVVDVVAANQIDVQIQTQVYRQPAEKFFEQLNVHAVDVGPREFDVPGEERPAGKIEYDARERLVHGHVERAVAGDAATVAQRFPDGLAEGDAEVFHGVVLVDFQIAFGGGLETDKAVLGEKLAAPAAPGDTDGRSSPGMLTSHYAPNASIRLDVTTLDTDELLLGFGHVACTLNLSLDGNLVEAAANLFSMLRQLDDQARETGARLAVSPIPMAGLGEAINDRLQRAAAPRP